MSSESGENDMGPSVSKMAALMGDIMLFTMYSGGIKYDAFFFTPALMAMEEGEFMNTEFLDFFIKDFNLVEHAKDFQFSDTETKVEFAKRFFSHLAVAENVPANIRTLAAKFAKGFEVRYTDPQVNGFIKPCPLYPFVRAMTLLSLLDKEIRGVNMKSLEIFVEFLLKDFDPKAYGIQDEANVNDIMAVLGHGFSGNDDPVILADGSSARQKNKELLEHLEKHDSVPQNVKQAITMILKSF